MDYDPAKLDETVLALLYLNVSTTATAWKGFDWNSLARLHARGLISNPKSKAKSVELTDSGARLAEQLFTKHFGAGRSTSTGSAFASTGSNRLCFDQPL